MGDTWIIDISHYLLPEGMPVPGPAGKFAQYFGSIVSAASVQPAGAWVDVAARCRRRPGRRPCPGHIRVRRTEVPARVEWHCTFCDDNGTIEGWKGTLWDHSRLIVPPPATGVIQIQVAAEELNALRHSVLDAESQAIVDGATVEGTTIWLAGSRDDMDNLAGYVAAEANHAPDREHQRVLYGVLERLLDVLADSQPNDT